MQCEGYILVSTESVILSVAWSPAVSKSNQVEIGLIKESRTPNSDPFESGSNSPAVAYFTMVENTGSVEWRLANLLRGKYWLSVRSVAFTAKRECVFPDIISGVQLHGSKCYSIPPGLRVDCGFPGIASVDCNARQCCFDTSHSGSYNCFHSFSNQSLWYFMHTLLKGFNSCCAFLGLFSSSTVKAFDISFGLTSLLGGLSPRCRECGSRWSGCKRARRLPWRACVWHRRHRRSSASLGSTLV